MSEGWLWLLALLAIVGLVYLQYWLDLREPTFDAGLCDNSTAPRDPRCDREFYPFIF